MLALIQDEEARRPAHHGAEDARIRETDGEGVARPVGVADQALAVGVHGIAPVDQVVGPLQEVEIRPVVRRDQIPGWMMGAGNQKQGVTCPGLLPVGLDQHLLPAPGAVKDGDERVAPLRIDPIGSQQDGATGPVLDSDLARR